MIVFVETHYSARLCSYMKKLVSFPIIQLNGVGIPKIIIKELWEMKLQDVFRAC